MEDTVDSVDSSKTLKKFLRGNIPLKTKMSIRACMPQLLSPCAATTEALAPRARALQQEAAAMRSLCTAMKSSRRSPQLEKALAQK